MARYLVSGIRGQDGRIAAELLQKLGHTVAGISHIKSASPDDLAGCEKLWWWDWTSEELLESILEDFKPDCFINLAVFHAPSTSDTKDLDTHKKMFDVNLTGLSVLIRTILKVSPSTMLINAASSQIYTPDSPGQIVNEFSIKVPQTFYGYTKLSGLNLIDYYRREHGLKAGSGILFNHESSYRASGFVTRVISKAVAQIKLGQSSKLHLRNIGAKADMSSAYDIVRGLLKMHDKNHNADYIFSSYTSTSIRDLVKFSFEYADLNFMEYVSYDEDRLNSYVVGDNSLSKTQLGWSLQDDIKAVMESMVDYDLSLAKEVKI